MTAEKTGRDINDAAVDEIRAVDESRPDSIPIVKVLSQEVARCGLAASDGTLTVEILRPTYTFTATGHFEPILSSSPALSIRLIESPEPMPSYRMSAGSGSIPGNSGFRKLQCLVLRCRGVSVFVYQSRPPKEYR